MASSAPSWQCRVCGSFNSNAVEVCDSCSCRLAANDAEVVTHLQLRETTPLANRPISRTAVTLAAAVWLGVLLAAIILRGRLASVDWVAWLFGIYTLRFLLKRWSDQPASLGAARVDESLSPGMRTALDLVVFAFVLWLGFHLVSGQRVAQ